MAIEVTRKDIRAIARNRSFKPITFIKALASAMMFIPLLFLSDWLLPPPWYIAIAVMAWLPFGYYYFYVIAISPRRIELVLLDEWEREGVIKGQDR